jgi:hypothetical protein
MEAICAFFFLGHVEMDALERWGYRNLDSLS